MPKAMEFVKLEVIRHWEHRMYQWMDAYRSGLGTTEAQARKGVQFDEIQVLTGAFRTLFD
jgi:hypothetical protein